MGLRCRHETMFSRWLRGGAAKELVVSRLIGMVEQEIYSREAFKPPCCGM